MTATAGSYRLRGTLAVIACAATAVVGVTGATGASAAGGTLAAAGLVASPGGGGNWAPIGPTNIGGRVTGIAASPSAPDTAYVATATAGVWKTVNAGMTFSPVWPSRFPQSIGAITVSGTGTLFVGTGEANPGCGDLSYSGNGVYRSTDGGRTWQNVGLRGSGEIGAIVIDPADPDTVYAAAAGTITRAGGQRGVYRSVNDGATWQRVLAGATPTTGAIDVALDPGSPRTLLAAMFQRRETQLNCGNYGGPGSGIYRSSDGGTHWARLGTANGLPGPRPGIGRIGVAFAPSAPTRAYAIIVRKRGPFQGFYTSADAGRTWAKLPQNTTLAQSQATYGWYYGRLWVDPRNPRHVFAAGLGLVQSRDGGHTWRQDFSVHVDWHALAWDPLVPGRVYGGNDGGFYTSNANARQGTWSRGTYEPWTQAYTVAVSAQNPSRVAGGTQDNGSIRSWGGPRFNVYFGGDGEANLINPDHQNIVYACAELGFCGRSTNGGNSFKLMHATSARWNWSAPLIFDPGDPAIMYWAGDRVNRSTNGGVTWTPISPDLTSGPGPSNLIGVIGGTVTALAASKSDPSVIYAGTDDGHLWVTRDLGAHWTLLLKNRPWVQSIAVGPGNANIAYVSFSTFRSGSDTPHVYMTKDGGRTWRGIDKNLPRSTVTDLVTGPRGHALFAALNDGTVAALGVHGPAAGPAWARVGSGLPDSPVMQLVDDAPAGLLYAATFGHGFYVLPLHPGAQPPTATSAGSHRPANSAGQAHQGSPPPIP
jgi:photosystem II stability/assembly factor-like uncharacterized protein